MEDRWSPADWGPAVLLLAGAETSADHTACVKLLTASDSDTDGAPGAVLSIALGPSPDDWLALWETYAEQPLPEQTVIASTATDTAHGQPTRSAQTQHNLAVAELAQPPSPAELVAVLHWYLGRWDAIAGPVRICLYSLTTLLDELTVAEVRELIGTINRTVAATDAVVHYHLDPADHDEQTIADLRAMFDTVVEHHGGDQWNVTQADREAQSFTRSAGTAERATTSTDGSPLSPPTPAGTRSISTALDLLSAPERRAVLYCLAGVDGPLPLDQLVERVGDLAPAVGTESWGERDTADLTVNLRHVHLPRLEEAGVIVVDDTTEQVRYRPNPTMEAYLDHTRQIELGDTDEMDSADTHPW